MSNSYELYEAMKTFTDARDDARAVYLDRMKHIESTKGSRFYDDESKKAADIRAAAVADAWGICWPKVSSITKAMSEANHRRGLTPPTEEQLRILQLLKLRSKLSLTELEQAAAAMDGNGSAIAVINDLARDNGYLQSFSHYAKGNMSMDDVDDKIKALRDACAREHTTDGVRYGAYVTATRSNSRYGTPANFDELPHNAPYEDKRDFYDRVFGNVADAFIDAVDD